MSKVNEQILDALRRLGGGGRATIVGEVKSVDKAQATCTVELPGGLVLEDVQLRTIKEVADGLTLLPAVGSTVTILNVGQPDWQVLDAEIIDEAILIIKDSKLTVNADGFKLERGSESLTKIITDLVKAVEQLTVTTSTGPSGTPINIATFQQIEQRIPNLLK